MAGEAATPVRRIERLLEYIRAHLDDELSVGVLAERAGFSPFHFQRVFRIIVGETVAEYVRKRRLQRAAIRLRQGEDTITDIALESGYETASAFTRAFSSQYGVAPTVFRADGSESPHVGGVMETRIERFERMRVLGMRHVGPYSQVKYHWPKMFGYAMAGGFITSRPLTIGLSYDDPDTVDHSQLRYDACFLSDAEGDEVLVPIVIEAGRWGVYRHVGPYELIGHAFDRLIDYLILHQQCELRDAPCMEMYLNDPNLVEPAECITDLAVPIV